MNDDQKLKGDVVDKLLTMITSLKNQEPTVAIIYSSRKDGPGVFPELTLFEMAQALSEKAIANGENWMGPFKPAEIRGSDADIIIYITVDRYWDCENMTVHGHYRSGWTEPQVSPEFCARAKRLLILLTFGRYPGDDTNAQFMAVSYTHLTLPTILLV